MSGGQVLDRQVFADQSSLRTERPVHGAGAWICYCQHFQVYQVSADAARQRGATGDLLHGGNDLGGAGPTLRFAADLGGGISGGEIENQDPTPAEFESADLRVEKIVVPGGKIAVMAGPLKPGIYKFFDDYHPDTAKGTVTAVAKVRD